MNIAPLDAKVMLRRLQFALYWAPPRVRRPTLGPGGRKYRHRCPLKFFVPTPVVPLWRPEKFATHNDIVLFLILELTQTHTGGGCFCVEARYFHQDNAIHHFVVHLSPSPWFTILHLVLIMFHYWQYRFVGVGLAFSISKR